MNNSRHITPEREALDNALYAYFESLGLDAALIDYSTVDEALQAAVASYRLIVDGEQA